MAEVEASKRRARSGRGGGINIIVMNAVLEACVSCGDVDLAVQLFEEMRGPMGCGVDDVSYGILLKVYSYFPTLTTALVLLYDIGFPADCVAISIYLVILKSCYLKNHHTRSTSFNFHPDYMNHQCVNSIYSCLLFVLLDYFAV
jgi:pentatricopeptide repeat protein